MPAAWHSLNIANLTYARGQKYIIDHIGFSIKRGEKIALIGGSGSGKSTLLHLLNGLYVPSKVNCMIDEKRYNELTFLQAFTTHIPQDAELFKNTILFNITLGLPASAQEVMDAAELAQFSSILAQLPQGLLTDVREHGFRPKLSEAVTSRHSLKWWPHIKLHRASTARSCRD
jgi:ABC-type bacteriocin/lantibiotic exporter with double-glycine peptidase domain